MCVICRGASLSLLHLHLFLSTPDVHLYPEKKINVTFILLKPIFVLFRDKLFF